MKPDGFECITCGEITDINGAMGHACKRPTDKEAIDKLAEEYLQETRAVNKNNGDFDDHGEPYDPNPIDAFKAGFGKASETHAALVEKRAQEALIDIVEEMAFLFNGNDKFNDFYPTVIAKARAALTPDAEVKR